MNLTGELLVRDVSIDVSIEAHLRCERSPGVTADTVLEAAASAELRAEHPLGKIIVAYVHDLSRALVEPEQFDHTPVRDAVATLNLEVVLVGNCALLLDHSLAAPANLLGVLNTQAERDGQQWSPWPRQIRCWV